MVAAFISYGVCVSRSCLGMILTGAIILSAGQSEAWAETSMLPDQALSPADRGLRNVVVPTTSIGGPERLEQTCPRGDCPSPPSQPTSKSLPGDRVAATPSATAAHKSCDAASALAVARSGAYAPRHAEIALTRRHRTFVVKGLVNECLTFEFYLDSGAADVTLSRNQFEQLRTAGAVFPAEISGRDTYVMADGRTSTQEFFLIRTLQLGPMVVRNVRTAVMPGDAPPLLGMSFLGRFYAWAVNNHREVLSLNFGSLPADRP